MVLRLRVVADPPEICSSIASAPPSSSTPTILRYFRRQGLLDELNAAGMLTWQGSGGFSVDASVHFEAEDRVRYRARPPFALERLHALDSSPALASPESRLLSIHTSPRPIPTH